MDHLPLDEDGDIPMRTLSQRHRRDRGWDLLVLITDLPRRAGTDSGGTVACALAPTQRMSGGRQSAAAGTAAAIGVGTYLNLVWLCSSVGIVAGALGSSLEDEETVRNATYGRRERERQERNRRQREDRTSAARECPTRNAQGDD